MIAKVNSFGRSKRLIVLAKLPKVHSLETILRIKYVLYDLYTSPIQYSSDVITIGYTGEIRRRRTRETYNTQQHSNKNVRVIL